MTGEGDERPSEGSARRPSVACPPYSRERVPLGPFTKEPFDLQPVVAFLPDGSWRPGPDTKSCLVTWLLGALHTAGLDLGEYDRTAVGLIADDGWTTVQVVAGWIARAHYPQDPSELADYEPPDQ